MRMDAANAGTRTRLRPANPSRIPRSSQETLIRVSVSWEGRTFLYLMGLAGKFDGLLPSDVDADKLATALRQKLAAKS